MLSVEPNSREMNPNTALTINDRLFKSYAKRKELKKFLKILDKFQVAYTFGSLDAQFVTLSNKDDSFKTNATAQKIFENNNMEITFIHGTKTPFYFQIMPKGQAKIDNHFFLLHVENFIYNLRAKGYAQYDIYQNYGDKSIKIIPVLNAGIHVDINQKFINAILCYFGEEALLAFDIFPTQRLRKTPLTDKRFQSLRFSRNAIWTHVKDLALNVNKALFTCFVNDRVLLAPPENLQALKVAMNVIPDKTTINPKPNTPPCVFCAENIIRTQAVFDFGKLLLMLNFRPFAGTKAHFLIFPTRHIEDWFDLRADERIILTLVIQSLLQAIQANCGVKESEIITYAQNGMQAGQTIPHSHMHVMTTPKYIPYLTDIYYQTTGMATPVLDDKKMAKISANFKPLLFQALSFNAPPPKLLTFDLRKDVKEAERLRVGRSPKLKWDPVK